MSNRSIIRDAVRRIQDVIASTLGRTLPGEAETRLEYILQSVANNEVAAIGESYSQREVTILLADLRGFMAIAESFPAREVLEALNHCFALMTEVVVQHYGTIDKFTGDGIMVVFSGDQGAPHDHARRALLCAVQMQIAMDQLNKQHKAAGMPEMFLGIGVNTGKVLTGLIGSDLYRAHTVIGEEVNLASRIEAFSLRGQVLVSQATYELCRDFADTGEPVQVYMKGKSEGVTIRELKAIPSLGKFVPRQELRRSARVDVHLPFSYQLVSGKAVMPPPASGTILDVGYDGVLAQLERSLPLYTEIKLSFDLPTLGYRADDVYGRIVEMREGEGRHLAGVEFTSVSRATNEKIRLFVQMVVQPYVSLSSTIARKPGAVTEEKHRQ
jgi:adenylate cyclase